MPCFPTLGDDCTGMTTTRVLVIDDDPISIEFLQEWLGPSQARIDTAMTAAAAEELLRVHDYDWLLVDKRLPDADGLAWLRQRLWQYPKQRAILLSGDLIELQQLPAKVKYLRKPVDGDSLLDALGWPMRMSLTSLSTNTRLANVVAPDLDDAQAMRALADNTVAVQSLRRMFHAELLAGRAWQESIEDAGALSTTRSQVHRLRAGAAITGCMRVAQLCVQIETALIAGAPPAWALAREFRAAIARLLVVLPH